MIRSLLAQRIGVLLGEVAGVRDENKVVCAARLATHVFSVEDQAGDQSVATRFALRLMLGLGGWF